MALWLLGPWAGSTVLVITAYNTWKQVSKSTRAGIWSRDKNNFYQQPTKRDVNET